MGEISAPCEINPSPNPNPKRKIKLNIIDNDTHNNSTNTTNTTNTTSNVIDIKNIEGLTYLLSIPNNSIDLILTDPPYIISKDSGMNDHYNNVKNNEENKVTLLKAKENYSNTSMLMERLER